MEDYRDVPKSKVPFKDWIKDSWLLLSHYVKIWKGEGQFSPLYSHGWVNSLTKRKRLYVRVHHGYKAQFKNHTLNCWQVISNNGCNSIRASS